MLSDQLPRLSPLLLAILASSAANTARAQDDELYFSKLPVVASVSRLAQPLSEAPGAVTVIDSEIIRASGARNLSDLMRLVPGFSVAPASQKPAVVAYHGLSNEEYTPRVQVLIDGRSQYSPLFQSGVNWNLMPVALEDIERIEVVRGSNAVSYGSNAFLGVINIITQHPSLARGWMVSGNHGNQRIDDSSLRWGGRAGNSDIRFTYRQQNDGGLKKMFDNNRWFDPHDSRHNQLFDVRIDTPLNDRDELSFALSHMADISQFGRPGANSASDPMHDRSQHSSSLSSEWRRIISADEDLRLRFTIANDWTSEHFLQTLTFNTTAANNVPVTSLYNGRSQSTRTELDFQHTFAPSKSTRLNWGATAQTQVISSVAQFSTTELQKRSAQRIFGNLEWRPAQKWLFNAGASLERDSIFGYAVDPRLSTSYHITPDHTLRFIASRAHRTPGLYEAKGDSTNSPINGAAGQFDRYVYHDPNLKPEIINTLEVGYLGEFKPLRASVDLRVYNESLPNRIVLAPYPLPANLADNRDDMLSRTGTLSRIPFPYGRADTPLNLERVSIRGFEQQWRWQPFESTRMLYSHAYTSIFASMDEGRIADGSGAGDDNSNTGKISRQTRDSAPRHSTSAMLIQQLPCNLEASVMYYKQAMMRWRRSGTPIRAFEQIDWRLAWRFRSGSNRGEIAYVAQAANGAHDAVLNTRIVKEMHWLTLRLDY